MPLIMLPLKTPAKIGQGSSCIGTNLPAVLEDTTEIPIVQIELSLEVHTWTSLIATVDVAMEYPEMAAVISLAHTWGALLMVISMMAYGVCKAACACILQAMHPNTAERVRRQLWNEIAKGTNYCGVQNDYVLGFIICEIFTVVTLQDWVGWEKHIF